MTAWLVIALLGCLAVGLALAHAESARHCWHESFVAIIDGGGWFGPL